MFRPKDFPLYHLLDRAKELLGRGGSTRDLVEVAAYLKFFPAQRSLRKELISQAYTQLSKVNRGDFPTYHLLFGQGVELFILDKCQYNPEIPRFALTNMKALSSRAHKYLHVAEKCEKELRNLMVTA